MKKTLDQKMAKELLEHGKTRVTDFYSQRTGKKFTADLLLELQGIGQVLKWNFQKENRKMRRDCSWENSMRFWDLPNMKRKKSAVLQEVGCIIWILHHNCTVTLF